MAKSRDSKTPKGMRRDPYASDPEEDEEDPFVKWMDKSFDWMKAHKVLTIIGSLMIIGIVLMISFGLIHWATGFTTLIFVRLGLHFFKPSVRSKTIAYATQNRVKMTLVVVSAMVLPILAPPLVAFYGGMYFKDWDRTMDPPKIYYVWIVDDSSFNATDQKKLARMNPGGEKNVDIKGLILLAAASVNLEGDDLVPFERASLRKDEPFSVIVFESEQEEKMTPVPPKEGEPVPETPVMQKQIVSHVNVYFITPKTDEEGRVKFALGKDGKKKALFKMVPYRLPPNLNVSFGMLAKGFSDATGRDIDLADLKVFLQKKKSEKPPIKDGPVIDGTRG